MALVFQLQNKIRTPPNVGSGGRKAEQLEENCEYTKIFPLKNWTEQLEIVYWLIQEEKICYIACTKVYRYTRNQRDKKTKAKKFKKLRERSKSQNIQQHEIPWVDSLRQLFCLKNTISSRLLKPIQVLNYVHIIQMAMKVKDNEIYYLFIKWSFQIISIRRNQIERLAANIRKSFWGDRRLIIGDWSAPQLNFMSQYEGKWCVVCCRKKDSRLIQ